MPTAGDGDVNTSQNSNGSNPLHAITQPPLSTGDKMFRMMPPMWNNGIMFKHTSPGPKSHDATMHATPTRTMSNEYGTNFLLPLVPLVCNSNTVSGWAYATNPGAVCATV